MFSERFRRFVEKFTVLSPETQAELSIEKAIRMFGLDLGGDPNINSDEELRAKLDEAEELGLERSAVYDWYIHGCFMKGLQRVHDNCCPWYIPVRIEAA